MRKYLKCFKSKLLFVVHKTQNNQFNHEILQKVLEHAYSGLNELNKRSFYFRGIV